MYSDIVKKGLEKTPHRSLFKASGFTDEEIERPLIGVVSAKNEIIPGHIHLDKIAEAVKTGVRIAGGTPLEFPAIGVCDGIAMGHKGMKYSLASRELIADSEKYFGKDRIYCSDRCFESRKFLPTFRKGLSGCKGCSRNCSVPGIQFKSTLYRRCRLLENHERNQ